MEFVSPYNPAVTLNKKQTNSAIIKFDCVSYNGKLIYSGDSTLDIKKRNTSFAEGGVEKRDCSALHKESLTMPSGILTCTLTFSERIPVTLDPYLIVWKCDDGRILNVNKVVDYKTHEPIDTIELSYHQKKSIIITFDGKGTYKGHLAYKGDLKVDFV